MDVKMFKNAYLYKMKPPTHTLLVGYVSTVSRCKEKKGYC